MRSKILRPIAVSIGVLLLCSFISCERVKLSIANASAHNLVVLTTTKDGVMSISEGLAVIVEAYPLDSNERYEMSITSPSERFTWYTSGKYIEIAKIPYISFPDILLPSGISVEEGLWKIEILSSDGQSISYELYIAPVHRDYSSLYSELPIWNFDNNQLHWDFSHIDDYDIPWNAVFYRSSGEELHIHTLDSTTGRFSLSSHSWISQVSHIILSRYDENRHMFIIGRMYIT